MDDCKDWDSFVKDSAENHAHYITNWLQTLYRVLDAHPQYQGISGEELQNVYDHKLPVTAKVDDCLWSTMDCSDYSWRGWGRLMAAYMNTKEKTPGKYDYMDFYMKGWGHYDKV
jgi:hypothetical protein